MNAKLRDLLYWACRTFGQKIHDDTTGELLGKAVIIAFGGRVYLFGYCGDLPLKPVWKSEDRVMYWRSRLVFVTQSLPDEG